MANQDYATLKTLIVQALDLVRSSLAPNDVQEILDYLDAAEYGLALETLVASLVRARVPVSSTLCSLMQDAAHRMSYGDDFSNMRNRDMALSFTRFWEACSSCTE